MSQHTTPDRLRGTYDRMTYDAVKDGASEGDRVELTYDSPYSGTTVETEGVVRNVGASSMRIELPDGREWGIFDGGIRTAVNSRRATGTVDPKNGRRIGYVDELRIYEG